jgi:hypothetical protein
VRSLWLQIVFKEKSELRHLDPYKKRRQLDPEWIELKPDESVEKSTRKICETI